MARRLREPTAFRADPAVAAPRPSRRQAVAVLAILAAVGGAVTAASYFVQPSKARSFDLFHGSLFLSDSVAPVGIDLATGKPTVRLADANAQVGAKQASDLGVIPASDGTLLLNRKSGEFNMVDNTGFVVKPNGGVAVESPPGDTTASGIAAKDFAYIEQTGATGTSFFLVGASTVAGATADGRSVQPRASVSMDEQVDSAQGATASVGNDLWVLVGNGGSRRIRHLSLPPDSDPGVRLDSSDAGSVSGPAALASAKANSDDPTEPAVALASADHLTVYRAGAEPRTLTYPRPVAGLQTVLAATNNDDRLSFLLHGSEGWSQVSVAPDGSDMQNPTLLRDIPRDAKLVPPASSRGSLYTMDSEHGRLFRVSDGHASSVDGMAKYPLTRQRGKAIEPGGFADASATGRGPRVVFNSPSHNKAVVLFTDGSRKPASVEKTDAVVVSAAGGAEALTRSRSEKPGRTPKPVKGPSNRKPAQPVNNSIDCKATSQRPHIPLLGQPQPGSRSVLLEWTYPITGQDDCIPATYVVNVERLSNSAPVPPSHVTVSGSRSVNLSGLYPSTRYEISVTAYINGRGTESAKIQVATGPEGPTAPRDVTAVADASGNWSIDWGSCGAAKSGCVTADSWRVIPQFCDGRGLSQNPSAIEVAADPTSGVQPGATLRGGTALLGRGLRFQVEGIGSKGEIGTPSAATPCVNSWRPPTAGDLTLTASRPKDAPVNQPATTTVALDLGSSPVAAVGGVGAKLTFTLTGPSGSDTRSVEYDGRTGSPSVSFPNVRAGSTYRASATVAPPDHPGSSVTVGPVDVVGRNTWPTLGVSATCPKAGLLTCNLSVNVFGISSSDIGGGRFDLTDDSTLRCGQVSRRIERTDFDPANATITVPNVSQTDKFYGDCTVQIGLTESAIAGGADHPYFGAAPSPRPTASVSLGDPTRASAGASDFTADWSTRSGSSAKITYNGNESLDVLTDTWSETLIAPDDSTTCGSGNSQPSSTDSAYVAATQDCIDRFGNGSRTWHVDVSYRNRSDGSSKSFRIDLVGAPPSYKPCDPIAFGASWGLTKADGVTVTGGGDQGGCSNWTYELRTSSGDVCNRVADGGAPTITIAIPSDCTAAPSDGWTVAISWRRPDGTTDAVNPPTPVLGAPPSS